MNTDVANANIKSQSLDLPILPRRGENQLCSEMYKITLSNHVQTQLSYLELLQCTQS